MHPRPIAARQLRRRPYRLHEAGFVVRELDGDRGGKLGSACELRFKAAEQYCPGTVDDELLDDGARKPSAGENGRVLRRRDKEPELLALTATSDEAEIVGLGAAAREHHILG